MVAEQEIQQAAHKTFEDLRAGREKNDLTNVIQDIESAKNNMTAKEYNQYLKALNNEVAVILPKMEIQGTAVIGGEHKLTVNNMEKSQSIAVDAHSARELDSVRSTQDAYKELWALRANTVKEQRGEFEVAKDATGDVKSITDKNGTTMYKGQDGKWSYITKEGVVEHDVFTNVSIDKQGNLKYDREKDHIERRADGKVYNTDGYDGTTTVYEGGKTIQTDSGANRQRKYHYDEKGQLDSIDGNLGHWDRTVKNGKSEWVNRDTGAVWQGEFKLDIFNNLTFETRKGSGWTFTKTGEDKRGLDN